MVRLFRRPFKERMVRRSVRVSNHNELTLHPYDSLLQVNVYEHGINLFKYHKLVFGCDEVNRFDHLIPLFASQKQFQLDLLGKESDFIQMNHPLRTTGTSKSHMQKLGGPVSGVFHLPVPMSVVGNAHRIIAPSEKRFLYVFIPRRRTMQEIAPYGDTTGLIRIVQVVVGQSETVMPGAEGPVPVLVFSAASYTMRDNDPYARITAYFPDGEVIYTNPFARYDASVAQTPYMAPAHTVNIPLTILFNFTLLVLCAGVILTFYKTVIKW